LKDTDEFQHSPSVKDADGNRWNGGVPHIAASLVRPYGTITDPFSGYLEYTPAKGEWDVWEAHRGGIGDAAVVLKQRYVAFFRDLLLLRWPDAAHVPRVGRSFRRLDSSWWSTMLTTSRRRESGG
jgi:hypothetical protein